MQLQLQSLGSPSQYALCQLEFCESNWYEFQFKGRGRSMYQLKSLGRERQGKGKRCVFVCVCVCVGGGGLNKFLLLIPFGSMQALHGLYDAHLHWGGSCVLLGSPIHMLISSGHSLTDTSRIHVQLNIWTPCGPVKLTHKINHHRGNRTMYSD